MAAGFLVFRGQREAANSSRLKATRFVLSTQARLGYPSKLFSCSWNPICVFFFFLALFFFFARWIFLSFSIRILHTRNKVFCVKFEQGQPQVRDKNFGFVLKVQDLERLRTRFSRTLVFPPKNFKIQSKFPDFKSLNNNIQQKLDGSPRKFKKLQNPSVISKKNPNTNFQEVQDINFAAQELQDSIPTISRKLGNFKVSHGFIKTQPENRFFPQQCFRVNSTRWTVTFFFSFFWMTLYEFKTSRYKTQDPRNQDTRWKNYGQQPTRKFKTINENKDKTTRTQEKTLAAYGIPIRPEFNTIRNGNFLFFF